MMATSAHGPVRVLMDLVHEAADGVPGEGHQQLMLGANSRITMRLFLAGTHHRPSKRTSSSNETADLRARFTLGARVMYSL